MDLLEYQAKELFQQIGIPILPSQTIHNTGELKRLRIPYPVVLKSQVRAGGRGKAGGVRFVENTIDAIAAATAIFHLPISGEYPEVVLAEARYDSQLEFFLAIVLDYQRQCPVLLGSSKGGMEVDTLLQYMEQVVLTEEFSLFHARRLAIKMGLKGELVPAVSDIIEKMYRLFTSKDLDLIEINPLGVNADGAVMALDGKIAVNDSAIARHPDLQKLTKYQEDSGFSWLKGDANAKIGLICNSYGLALSSWDLLSEAKGKLVGAAILEEFHPQVSLIQQLEGAIKQLRKMAELQVILINYFGCAATSEMIAAWLHHQLNPQLPSVKILNSEERTIRATGTVQERALHSRHSPAADQIPIVLRLAQGNLEILQAQTHPPLFYGFTDLEPAIAKTLDCLEPFPTD
jgi:succinyl-CoA synthetase beta subunit